MDNLPEVVFKEEKMREFDNMSAPSLYEMTSDPSLDDRIVQIVTDPKLNSDIDHKFELMDGLMKEHGWTVLARGTNRTVYKSQQFPFYVIKIGFDRSGMQDCKRELANQEILKPFCAKCFSISPSGCIGIFERVRPIIEKELFLTGASDIYNLLIRRNVLGKGFIMDDIGADYYMNYGMTERLGPVLLDYPSLYKIKPERMICNNTDQNNIVCGGAIRYERNYNYLECEKCHKRYFARDVADEVLVKDIMKLYTGGINRYTGGSEMVGCETLDVTTGEVVEDDSKTTESRQEESKKEPKRHPNTFVEHHASNEAMDRDGITMGSPQVDPIDLAVASMGLNPENLSNEEKECVLKVWALRNRANQSNVTVDVSSTTVSQEEVKSESEKQDESKPEVSQPEKTEPERSKAANVGSYKPTNPNKAKREEQRQPSQNDHQQKQSKPERLPSPSQQQAQNVSQDYDDETYFTIKVTAPPISELRSKSKYQKFIQQQMSKYTKVPGSNFYQAIGNVNPIPESKPKVRVETYDREEDKVADELKEQFERDSERISPPPRKAEPQVENIPKTEERKQPPSPSPAVENISKRNTIPATENTVKNPSTPPPPTIERPNTKQPSSLEQINRLVHQCVTRIYKDFGLNGEEDIYLSFLNCFETIRKLEIVPIKKDSIIDLAEKATSDFYREVYLINEIKRGNLTKADALDFDDGVRDFVQNNHINRNVERRDLSNYLQNEEDTRATNHNELLDQMVRAGDTPNLGNRGLAK